MLTTKDLVATQSREGGRRTSRLASATLRIIARTVEKSLPREARRVLRGTQLHYGDLPCNDDGCQIEGCARTDGHEIILDRRTIEENVKDERYLESILAHECAHIFRARTGQHDNDEAAEERGACRLVREWGFRKPR